jgi:hypothetical protein
MTFSLTKVSKIGRGFLLGIIIGYVVGFLYAIRLALWLPIIFSILWPLIPEKTEKYLFPTLMLISIVITGITIYAVLHSPSIIW